MIEITTAEANLIKEMIIGICLALGKSIEDCKGLNELYNKLTEAMKG